MYNSLIYRNACTCRTSYTWATFHHHQRGIQTEPAQAMWPVWSVRWEMTDITCTILNNFWSELNIIHLYKSSCLVILNSTIKKTVKISRCLTTWDFSLYSIRINTILILISYKKMLATLFCMERYNVHVKALLVTRFEVNVFCCLKVMRWKSAWVYPRRCVERYVGLRQGGLLSA